MDDKTWIAIVAGIGFPLAGGFFAAIGLAIKFGRDQQRFKQLEQQVRKHSQELEVIMRFQYRRGWREAKLRGHLRLEEGDDAGGHDHQ